MIPGRVERCHICGKPMREFKGVYLCLPCNERYGEFYNFFTSASKEYLDYNNHVVIECPGATILTTAIVESFRV